MTADRVYSTLLRLYPAPFRERFGAQMLDAFGDLRRARRDAVLSFWAFVLGDVARSAASEQLAACRSGTRRFALEWTVPPWCSGALVGATLGLAQVAALGRRCRIGLAWIAASTAATAIGVETAVALAPIAGAVGYGVVLGVFVGGGQWTVLRSRGRLAVRWVALNTAAVSLVLMSWAATLHTTLAGMDALSHSPFDPRAAAATRAFLVRGMAAPATGADIAIELAVMAVCGLITATVTTRPLSSLYVHQNAV